MAWNTLLAFVTPRQNAWYYHQIKGRLKNWEKDEMEAFTTGCSNNTIRNYVYNSYFCEWPI